jgi:2-polyprenyl-6-methoxyphenol hydroxylase-like FAD-dependent oxidoreductase
MARTHAIVIGGSLAGLAAARVLSELADRVTVLERDRYPAEIADRKGVPQGRHNHSLLGRGTLEFERLFPGFEAFAVSHGAELRDQAWDTAMLTPFGWAPRYRSHLKGIAASRALIEHSVRNFARKLPNVSILEGVNATGLDIRRDGSAMRCVAVEVPPGAAGNGGKLEADLVVDASGANSRADAWLQAAGLAPPRETTVDPMAGYSSRWFVARDPASWPEQWWWSTLITARQPDENFTEAIISRVEHGRWHLSVAGFNRRYPPNDEEEFMAMLPRLRTPLFAEMVKRMEPISAVYSFRRLDNRWRHYETWRERLAGFVAVGDAACAFNPVYATGMSALAMSAGRLGDCVRRFGLASAAMPPQFFREQARLLADPWMWTAALDLRLPYTIGKRSAGIKLFDLYVRLAALAGTDPIVRDAFVDAANLLRPTSAVYAWPVLRRVLGAVARYAAQVARGHAPAIPAIPALPPSSPQ